MTVTINHPDVNRLLRQLTATTGESEPEAVALVLRERLAREQARRAAEHRLAEELLRIGRECAALTVLDDRPAVVILGYDKNGLPT
jgi:hypothetical protein